MDSVGRRYSYVVLLLFAAIVAVGGQFARAEEEPIRFERVPGTRAARLLTSDQLDDLLARSRGEMLSSAPSDPPSSQTSSQTSSETATETASEATLVRLTLDLVGRQPTPEELAEFQRTGEPLERAARRAIDRLLASPECGANWANYFSDVISYRTPEPELTFLNYTPLKGWLAERFNARRPWDETVFEMLTATGKVGENPAATFIGFHQANRARLASETTRVFLGLHTQCAECHDHPFTNLSQETFHSLAAFFARTDAKLPWNDSSGVEVKSKKAGEHQMPGHSEAMPPAAFEQTQVALDAGDLSRRAELAKWLIAADNPWFAKAMVNRVWARLMGQAFTASVDDVGPDAEVKLPEVFEALANHFIAGGYDLHELLRVIVATKAYRETPVAGISPLRGDEVYDSLSEAIKLPNYTPPAVAATDAIRFPPPPKSTRDLVNVAFGYDPSLGDSFLTRTMPQAMFLMNNSQVQKQVSADPASETPLARLLIEISDDAKLVETLYRQSLGRSPTSEETKIAMEHVHSLAVDDIDRRAAFEDLLWCLINSAEFTTRR